MGLAALKIGREVGFITEQGEMVIEPQYNNMVAFNEGLASLRHEGIYIVINKNNEIVYQSESVLLDEFSGGFSRVLDFDKKEVYYVNKKFEQASPSFSMDYNLSDFENGFASIIDKDGKYGVINRKGEIIVPVEYDFIFQYGDDSESDMFTVEMGDKLVFYDTLGNQVLKPYYDYESHNFFSEGLAVVSRNNKYGFINLNCKEVIKLQYDSAYSFSEGLAAVCLNGKWGFINKRNKVVIPFQYDDVNTFYDGLAAVKLNGKYGFVNKEGKQVIDFKYDDIIYQSAFFYIQELEPIETVEKEYIEVGITEDRLN